MQTLRKNLVMQMQAAGRLLRFDAPVHSARATRAPARGRGVTARQI